MTCDVSNWSAGHFAMSQWQKTTFSYVPALVRVPTECHGDYNKDTRCQNYRINILNQQSTAESILQQTDNVNLTQLHECRQIYRKISNTARLTASLITF